MRRGKYAAVAAICTVVVLIGGCGKKDEGNGSAPQGQATGQSGSAGQTATAPQSPAQSPASAGVASDGAPSPTNIDAMAEQNRQKLAKMNDGKQITAVSTASLKGLLPETLAGLKRTSASAEHNQAMGIDMSKAEGQYEGPNDAYIDLTITDVGNMSGSMRMGMAGWTMAQYDRETDTGYEKTATYSGYKGMEEYDTESKSGTIRVYVADRFIIELEGSNITIDTLKQALDQIDLKKVASMASGS